MGTQVSSTVLSVLCYFAIFIHDQVPNHSNELCRLSHSGVIVLYYTFSAVPENKWLFLDMSSIVCGYRGTVAAPRGNSPGKCRHLADRSCTSGAAGEFNRASVAIWRIDRVLVAPPGGYIMH